MAPRSVNMRDAGLALISRINRWLIAGAVGLTGVISVAAANAFHGRTVSHSSSTAGSSPSSAAVPAPSSAQTTSNNSESNPQPPASAPAPAPAAPSPPVVSGGS